MTVLRSGGEYEECHVDRLREQCEKHAPDTEFVCLSDIGGTALLHDWPGWWAKIEVFRFQGPILFVDLDTTIRGDLRPILDAAACHEFIALEDFNPRLRKMGSGLMAWGGSMSHIYETFCANPDAHMAKCTTRRHFGDQGFIEPLTEGRTYWQDILPGSVVSWKKHCKSGVPDDAKIVCFHGKPRPWDVGQ
ncbi:hypothetical protein [Roseovarius indicus]|nr:hypothetical protein [Roseovarius indicus]KRS17530.1 hypothetical protein XM52_13710 [Roseovarius indicus]